MSLGAVLEQYPDEAIVYVCDPRTGIQRRCKWPPAISEIVEACDEAAAPKLRQQERDRAVAQLLAEREAIEAQRGEVRPTLEQLKAKYGPDWGLDLDPGKKDRPTFKAPSWDDIAQTYKGDPSLIARLTEPREG